MSEYTRTNVVEIDDLSPDEVRGYFEPSFDRRSFNPLESDIADEALKAQLQNWREDDKTIVFTVGCYDLFHANHRAFLLRTKLAAAPCVLKKEYGLDWNSLSRAEQAEFTNSLLDQDSLKLIVSVDGNERVAANKGFNPEKGGSVRPIYDWRTRSRDVLSASYELEPGRFKPIVDAVTMYDSHEPALAGTPHVGPMELAEMIQPDVWSVFEESEDILEAVQTTHAETFENTRVRMIPATLYYGDKLLGGPFSTTAIVRRVGGTAVGGA